ncbi:MAG: PD-(D/E)XK nuclease-like domain-containing protein [Acutalibacteraceae bacterium]|nr:PD-(D/E)XK nuclease-like domain-containing protein [Acutalibacteraceae bacterium]
MQLTQRNYFSKKASLEYMSVSQFKAFQKCPEAALAEIKGRYEREKTTALLVGSYVDSHFEGTLPQFKYDNPDIFKKDGTLKNEYLQAEAIIDRIQRDRMFTRYMSGRKQVIMTGEIEGVKVKIKVDSLHKDKIVDLKVVKDFRDIYDADRGSLPWYSFWNYEVQGAVYQEIVRQNTGNNLPFYLAAATKEKVTDLDIIEIEQPDLDFALEVFRRDVEYFDAIKKGAVDPVRCEKCDYCKQTKVLKEPTKSSEYIYR